jgi:aspartyl-tRNA(Asn)/glutamyl-tRNA(Gln) amidotransferase subunit B
MPELPAAKKARFIESYGLREYDAQVLTATRPLSEYFDQAAEATGDPQETAKWVQGELLGMLKAEGKEITDSPIPPAHVGELVKLISEGKLTGKLAKEIFPKMFTTGNSPQAVMESENLQVLGGDDLSATVDDVLANNQKQVEQYKGGKTAVIGFLVGQVMKATRGQADPKSVNQLLRKKLGG